MYDCNESIVYGPTFGEIIVRKIMGICFQPSPSKIPRLYGTPIRTRLDHPYSAPRTKTVATQTEDSHIRAESMSHSSSITLRPALPIEPSDAERSDPDIPTAMDSGSSYGPSSSSPTSTDTDSGAGSPVNVAANKYVVFREQLDELLKYCSRCGQTVTNKSRFSTGSMLSVRIECHAGHAHTWQSQPVVRKTPMGNLLMSAAILFAGLTHKAVADMAACLGLLFFTQPVFDQNQKEILFPVIEEAWDLERQGTVIEVKDGGLATLAGDARCDTPGHNAKYGSYTLMQIDGDGRKGTNKIVALELVQVSEVSPCYK